jgi:hypothetical protein
MSRDEIAVITNVITATIALAALGLGVLNYRRQSRRDTFDLRAELRPTMIADIGEPSRPYRVQCQLTNVGQRPVVATNVALILGEAKRRRWLVAACRKRRWMWLDGRRDYRLLENLSIEIEWPWDVVVTAAKGTPFSEPIIKGVRVVLSGPRNVDIRLSRRASRSLNPILRDLIASQILPARECTSRRRASHSSRGRNPETTGNLTRRHTAAGAPSKADRHRDIRPCPVRLALEPP